MVLVIDNYYYVGEFLKTAPRKFITYNVEFILIYITGSNWNHNCLRLLEGYFSS